MKTDIKQFLRKDHTRILFLAPALIFIALFILYPLLSSVVLALSDITFPRGVLTTKFSGFKNFAKILKQEIFWTCVKNTVVFVICRITGTFVMGLIVAMIVVRAKGIMSHILKTLFLVPWALSDVVNGTMWDWMYNGKYGIINEILLKLHLIDQYQPWLSMGKTAL
ncbi:MAG: sugar ABC transporter permease [Spirochaetales bacterium]|nr:sugar ABC transporter permease [Spirochaetales bacterium]